MAAATTISIDRQRQSDALPDYGPLVAAPVSPACEAIVIIPARDEREALPDALAALAGQLDLCGRPLDRRRFEVIVLANNCQDDTSAVAQRTAARHPGLALHVVDLALPGPHAHVGAARRLLMDEAARRLLQTPRGARGVIASTDADTRVAPDWLAATLAEVERGADAVGGRIIVDPTDLARWGTVTRAWYLRDIGYRSLVSELDWYTDPTPSDPWPRHFQHFGPSIAVTVAAYERAGQLPAVAALEDVGLYTALHRVDARIRHSPAVRVVTSGREIGRTGFGFAVQLGLWTGMGDRHEPFLVESPAAIVAAAAARRQLRRAWLARQRGSARLSSPTIERLASDLCLTPRELAGLLEPELPFGAIIEHVEGLRVASGCWAERWPPAEIGLAIAELRVRLAALRQPSTVRSNRSSR